MPFNAAQQKGEAVFRGLSFFIPRVFLMRQEERLWIRLPKKLLPS